MAPIPKVLKHETSSFVRAQEVGARAAAAAMKGVNVTLQRLVSQDSGAVVETSFCGICLENCPTTEMSQLTGTGGCSHTFCSDCIAGYLTVQIKDGTVNPPCPYFCQEDGCGGSASEEDVRKHVSDPDILEKYERFAKMAENSDHRECPSCQTMQLPKKNLFGRVRPEMTCVSCDKEFCFYHANAHEGTSCLEYTRATTKEEQVSTNFIKGDCKNCPKCKAPTFKDRGCNHMTCIKCKPSTDWCWLCNADITGNVDWHYNPANVRGCAGAQFSQTNGRCHPRDRAPWQSKARSHRRDMARYRSS